MNDTEYNHSLPPYSSALIRVSSHLYVASNELRSPGERPEFRFPNGLYVIYGHRLVENGTTCIRILSFLGCSECIRCRLLLPTFAVSVSQSVCHVVALSRGRGRSYVRMNEGVYFYTRYFSTFSRSCTDSAVWQIFVVNTPKTCFRVICVPCFPCYVRIKNCIFSCILRKKIAKNCTAGLRKNDRQ